MSQGSSHELLPDAALHKMFVDMFGNEPELFQAPGRVNLIGEHTDYNDGWVMPIAINLFTRVVIAAAPHESVHVHSLNFDESIDIELPCAAPDPGRERHWSDYVRGVIWTLQQRGYRIGGANILLQSGVPLGSGLSSSAALEVALALALLATTGSSATGLELARWCQQAENEYVGMQCSIMDQYASANGRAGQALLLDCRFNTHEVLPLPERTRIVVCNTMVKHSHAGGEYNRRREECAAALNWFRQQTPGKQALRDVTLAEIDLYGRGLDPVLLRRCRHVISENQRVGAAARALREGNLHGLGLLMQESHASLRDDYEVSCKELDLMVSIALQTPGVIGARMTGGGFGGCTVNLVADDAVSAFCEQIARVFQSKTGLTPVLHVVQAVDGARRVEVQ